MKSPLYFSFVVSVDIQFTYPPMYPDEVPGVEIVSQTGLSPEQATELETYLKEQVQPAHKAYLIYVFRRYCCT